MNYQKQSSGSSHISMANDYPIELVTGERVAHQSFSDNEELYIRFEEIHGDIVAIASLRCPNQSTYRSTVCTDAKWVLLSEPPDTPDQFKYWGYGYVSVGNIPSPLTSPSSIVTEFKPLHDPTPYNYSHTEIRAYRSGNEIHKLKKNVRLNFRIKLSQEITILKKPDLQTIS